MKKTLKSLLLLCALFTAASAWAINEDYINKVGDWSNQGNTYNAGGIIMRERYWAGQPDAGTTVMDQTISGIPNGWYTVELYAYASFTTGRGFTQVGNQGDLNRAYLFANNAELGIPIIHQTGAGKPSIFVLEAQVTDGTLHIGIEARQQGANWYLLAAKSIKYRGTEAVAKTTNSGTWWSKQGDNNPGGYTCHSGLMVENYVEHSTGKMLSQTITGLDEGYYHVGVYAAASQAWRDKLVDDGTKNCTFAYTLSNGEYDLQRISVPVYNQTGVTVPGMYDFYNVHVGSDGKLEVGLTNDEQGSNWQIMSVKDIHYLGTNPDYSHLIGENQSDWQGATGMVGWASCIKMVENYQNSQVVGSALMTRQITGLPVGLYTLKMYCNANRANGVGASLPSEGVENTALVVTGAGEPMTQMVKVYSTSSYTSVADMQLFTFEDIEVDDAGTIDIAIGNAVAGANWFTVAGESLVWTGVSLKLLQTSLQNAIDAASLRTEDFMSTATWTALTSAISAAQAVLNDEDATEEQLNSALTNLQDAVAAIDTWQADWANAKKPLIAALERFEADYNDGANGALRKMSTEAWNTLVTAAGAAATAKDQYEDLTALGTAAATFNAAMDVAEPSITLYNKYELLMTALDRYNAELFPNTKYDTEAHHATDAAVTAAIDAMNADWATYKGTLEGNQDVTALAGENMSFESEQGEQLNGNAYKQPEWDVTYVYTGVDGNKQYETFTTETDDLHDGATGQALHMRNRWAGENGKMQITKTLALPAGEYGLSAWMKVMKSTDGHLCYYVVDGTPTDFVPALFGEWVKVKKDIKLDAPAVVTISFGVSGGKDMDVYVDDITLTLYNQTAYERAYAAADALRSDSSPAIVSALAQYPKATQTEAEAAEYDIAKATAVLLNAVTIANANNVATGLLTNADFTGGTNSLTAEGGGQIYYPSGWTFTRDFSGWNDCSVGEKGDGVFNMWAGTIHESELSQVMSNMPNGIYKISGEFKCDILGGKSGIGIFADQLGTDTGRSIDVGTNSDNNNDFYTYSAIVEVKDHKLRVGVNSRGGYYQLKNFQVKMLAASENDETKADVANSRLYQELAFNRNALEYDFTGDAYANVSGANPLPMLSPNSLIKANEGQIADNTNVIINGICANLVLTDKESFKTTTGFTATNASYTRTMPAFKNADDEEVECTWGTIILPYAVSSGNGVQYYTLKKVVDGEGGYMSFEETSKLAANTPGVFVTKTANVSVGGSNLPVVGTTELASAAGTENATGWQLNGTYEEKTFTAEQCAETDYYYIANEKFWHSTKGFTVAPFRAYFTTSGSNVRSFRLVVEDNSATTIKLVPVAEGEQVIYTLSGTRINGSVESLSPGVYIINNKKTVVK